MCTKLSAGLAKDAHLWSPLVDRNSGKDEAARQECWQKGRGWGYAVEGLPKQAHSLGSILGKASQSVEKVEND